VGNYGMPTQAVFTVGRGPKSDAVLQHSSISRRHAEIRIEPDGKLRVTDLDSSYGTFVHRGGTWRRIEDEVVGADEPVMFGKHQTTLARVLEVVLRDGKATTTGPWTAAEKSTRRQAAILVADVVGYSRMMAENADATLRAIRDCRRNVVDPTVLHHRGRIFKELGDAILSEFRLPADALRCANAIQCAVAGQTFGRAPRALEFRVGIHFGEAIAEDGDLFGDAVNIAERLQQVAAPGRIAISALVQMDAANRYRFEAIDLGEKSLKNIPYAVHVYEIVPGEMVRKRKGDADKPARKA
jgi:class 3 adenylate cyclase